MEGAAWSGYGAGEVASRRKRAVLEPLPFLAPQALPARPPSLPGAPAAALDTAPRPGSAAARPRTAGSRNRPPLGGDVAFPAGLRLRGPGDAPGPLGPWSPPGEAFVVPLETQEEIRRLAEVCGEGRRFVEDGELLTVWALLAGPPGAVLEPLAARRADRSLAVEPIELALERQAAAGVEGAAQQPLRYGEGFRLRAAGCAGLYLGHAGGGGDGLRWTAGGAGALPPRTRFAAHGGELGAPVLLGRPLSLQRVASPPPRPAEDTDYDSESSGGESSGSDAPRRQRRAAARPKTTPPAAAAETACDAAEAAAASLLPEARRYVKEGLFSRAADSENGVFAATLLPLLERPCDTD